MKRRRKIDTFTSQGLRTIYEPCIMLTCIYIAKYFGTHCFCNWDPNKSDENATSLFHYKHKRSSIFAFAGAGLGKQYLFNEPFGLRYLLSMQDKQNEFFLLCSSCQPDAVMRLQSKTIFFQTLRMQMQPKTIHTLFLLEKNIISSRTS